MSSIDQIRQQILNNLDALPVDERKEFLGLFEEYEKITTVDSARDHFLDFVQYIWPEFIHGKHHKIMSEAFDRVISGKCKRLIVNMPPRHTKSEFASFLLPAYFLGKYPNKKIIMSSHTAELSVDFGRRVRNLVATKDFQEVFPGVGLQADSKAAGRWNTNKNGIYFAVGVGGKIAGRGADLFIVDDAHSEQEFILGLGNPDVYHKAFQWYTAGPRQRLQPNAAIVIVMTRWSKIDLTGQLIKQAANDPNADQWEVIEFPAILPSGTPIWPEFWKLEELERTKASLPVGQWNAQYQQNPTSEAAAILKRDWWKRWERDKPPKVDAILMSWDTAFEKTEIADYSACTVWGVFDKENEDNGKIYPNIILLDAFKKKMEFPELKRKVKEMYDEWEPDSLIIEKKSSGAPLIYELQSLGIPVAEFTPTRGNDKISRANAVSDLFSSGTIWAPMHRWAEEVIEECGEFPGGEYDDYVDSVTQAILRFRQGGWVRTPTDEWDDEVKKQRRKAYY